MSLFGRAAILGRQPSAAAGGTLPAAVLATSPSSYWQLRETSGSSADDLGSLANDGAITGLTLASRAGPAGDGFSYPVNNGLANPTHGVQPPDNNAYSIGASGMTVMFFYQPTGTPSTQRIIIGKPGEWNIMAGAFTDSTEIYARVINASNQLNVSKYGVAGFVDGTWKLAIVRYGANGGSIASVRINGGSPSMNDLNPGFGAGANNANAVIIFGPATTSTATVGAIAHAAIWNRQLSDVECGSIESAADTDGWY